MAFTKITAEDRAGKGNVGQPDTPMLSTTEMQEQMDSLPNLAIDTFNTHIDEISAETGANNVGCAVPDGITASANVGSIVDAIASEIALAIGSRHIHANKSVLDTITANRLEDITTVINLLVTIDQIESAMTNNPSALPTSSAVYNYINGYDIKAKIKNAIYPLGAVYMTTLIDPDSVFGTTGEWQLVSTDANGIKAYKRIR